MLIDHLFISHHNLTLDNSEFKVSLASQQIAKRQLYYISIISEDYSKKYLSQETLIMSFIYIYINPRTYTQIHTRTLVQGEGGCMKPLPELFDMLQDFEAILPSVESI